MFFRNALTYRITNLIDFSNIEELLQTKQCKPCESSLLSTYGFMAPFGKDENAPLTRQVKGYILIATKKEERILPASVIKKELNNKVNEIEKRDSRKVYKKEKDQLKNEIVQTLLPKSFIKESFTYAFINSRDNLIIVEATSANKAEELLSLLREALGSLPIVPLQVKIAPSAIMTKWVKGQQPPKGFNILEECTLKDTLEDGGLINCKKQDLTTEEIQLHLKSGKLVTQLALAWQDKLSFILDKKLAIKRLKFEDLLQQEIDNEGGDDAVSQFDATFFIAASNLSDLIQDIVFQSGGIDK